MTDTVMIPEKRLLISMERLHELLVQLDAYHELLGVELLPAMNTGDFDPDRYYTPMENRIHRICELCGFDYHNDIREIAYARNKE